MGMTILIHQFVVNTQQTKKWIKHTVIKEHH